MSIIQSIANAIADVEGYTTGASKIAVDNNNPGNIRVWAGKPYDKYNYGFVVFPDINEGWRALYKVVGDYINGRYTGGKSPTLIEMFSKYAPAADKNDPIRYAKTVSAKTGIPLDVPLNMVGVNPPTPVVKMSEVNPIISTIEDNPFEYLFLPLVLGISGFILLRKVL